MQLIGRVNLYKVKLHFLSSPYAAIQLMKAVWPPQKELCSSKLSRWRASSNGCHMLMTKMIVHLTLTMLSLRATFPLRDHVKRFCELNERCCLAPFQWHHFLYIKSTMPIHLQRLKLHNAFQNTEKRSAEHLSQRKRLARR